MLWGKYDENVFFWLFFWVLRSNRSICLFFMEASINTAHQTRLTFDLEIRDNPWSLLFVPDKATYMSVGDSAEEFMSIHALGRERLLVLSCGLPSHPLKFLFFARWETIESFCLSFYTLAAKCVFSRSLIGARRKSPTVE